MKKIVFFINVGALVIWSFVLRSGFLYGPVTTIFLVIHLKGEIRTLPRSACVFGARASRSANVIRFYIT